MIAAMQYEDRKYAGYYNVGPDDCDCVTTGDIVDTFVSAWGENASWVNKSDGGPHEASFLKLNSTKLKSTFGWEPRWHIDEAVSKSVEWYKCYVSGGDVIACMDNQIRDFFE